MKLTIAACFAITTAALCCSLALAGPERAVTDDPTFITTGNKWRTIQIAPSTNTVLISTDTPNNAGLGSGIWRERVITNYGNGRMNLWPNSTFTQFISSAGIMLNPGDSYQITHQATVFGIWEVATSTTGSGAGGYESYDKR